MPTHLTAFILSALVAFCTFGVVQSYGVYQDYYTVGGLANLIDNGPFNRDLSANVTERANTLCYKLDRLSPSLSGLRRWSSCWKTPRSWLLSPDNAGWDYHLYVLVSLSSSSSRQSTYVGLVVYSCFQSPSHIGTTRLFSPKDSGWDSGWGLCSSPH